MALSAGQTLGAAVLGLLALAFAAIAYALRRTQPVAYRIEPDAVVIERRTGATRIPGPVEPHLERVTLGLRMGSGGLYGYRGRFRISSGGWARAIVTDVRRAVLIRVGGRPLVLSPVDPDALVREVRDA
jgi:hypothetical protein